MTVLAGLVICAAFYLLVRRCSIYLYGVDRCSFLRHMPCFTGGYATIGRAFYRWISGKGPYYSAANPWGSPPKPADRREDA